MIGSVLGAGALGGSMTELERLLLRCFEDG